MEEFLSFYENVDDALKLSYLRLLLESDKNLQNEFISFVNSFKQENEIDIEDLKEEIAFQISELEFDYGDISNYYEYEYYESGEMGYDLVKELLKPYFNKIKYFIENRKILDALKIYIALKELQFMEIDANDELFFGEEADVVKNIVEYFEDELFSLLENKIDDNTFYKFADIVTKKRVYENFKIDAYYEFFKNFINQKRALYLIEKIGSITENNFKTFILLLEATENKEDELKYLEKYYHKSDELLERLFKLYKELILDDKINSLSLKLMSEGENNFYNKNYYSCFILKYLDKNRYKKSYIKALKGCILKNTSNKEYEELKELVSKEERLKFLKEELKPYSFSLYLEFLNLEGEYKEILNEVDKNIDEYYSFSKVIDYLIKPYPKELFELTKKRANILIAQRGRYNYQRVVKYLLRFKDIKEIQNEFRTYIKSIYYSKPTLPALRKELKNAGLIEGF